MGVERKFFGGGPTSGGGGGLAAVRLVRKTSGDISGGTLNTGGNWALMADTDVSLPAAVGDYVELSFSMMAQQGSSLYLDWVVVDGSTIVRSASNGAGAPLAEGLPGLYPNANTFRTAPGTFAFTVAPADLVGGQVKFQLAAKGAGTGVIYKSASYPMQLLARNFGVVDDDEHPGPSNTGHLAWPDATGSLTPYAGPSTIGAAGSDQVFEGVSFEGLTIGTSGNSPNNITFRGCRFRSSWNGGWNVQVRDADNIVFEWCTFEPLNTQTPPIALGDSYQYAVDIRGSSGVTVQRCNIYGFGNGIQLEESSAERPVRILDSYFHDAADQAGDTYHHDAILSNNGGPSVRHIAIERNTIISGGNTNAIALQSTTQPYSDIRIVGNRVSGFGYTINVGDGLAGGNTNVVIEDNVFSTDILPAFGPFKNAWPGLASGCSWRRNRWKYAGNGSAAVNGWYWLPTSGVVADWNNPAAWVSDTDYDS